MLMCSTRGGGVSADAPQAVITGLAPGGGLFVPEAFADISGELKSYMGRPYHEICAAVLHKYFDEFGLGELEHIAAEAYSGFDTPEVAPLKKLNGGEYVLELWHGPTLAFKDMALQVLPRLLGAAKKLKGLDETTLVLVATSGDTGKAALEGFADVSGTEIAVFYPDEGVSHMQKLQMVTQEGANTHVAAVRGNFDDAQTGVKRIFEDACIARLLGKRNIRLSSANSINFGRLAPQIAYYVCACVRLMESGVLKPGGAVNFAVPTGNFGNILAAYYAKRMGAPIGKLICASNVNNVLSDFFASGEYVRTRPFHKTMSPSMDILISSNLERLIYEACNRSGEKVAALMSSLAKDGRYAVGVDALGALLTHFAGGYASEEDTARAIKSVFTRFNYLMDPHTAVAQSVYEAYAERTGDDTPTVVVSTASPYKFCADVLCSIGRPRIENAFNAATELERVTGVPIPKSIAGLKNKPVRHALCVDNEDMAGVLMGFLDK